VELYRHTQFGYIMVGLNMAVFLIVVLFMPHRLPWPVLPLVVAVLVLITLVFGWLTVAIRQGRLTLRFGIGLIRKSFPISEIRSCRPVRNSWAYGWGIRMTPHGWLYNVSGLDAVEIALADGKKVRVGTDEPDALCRAIDAAAGISA
jgi:hypothetical protein